MGYVSTNNNDILYRSYPFKEIVRCKLEADCGAKSINCCLCSTAISTLSLILTDVPFSHLLYSKMLSKYTIMTPSCTAIATFLRSACAVHSLS